MIEISRQFENAFNQIETIKIKNTIVSVHRTDTSGGSMSVQNNFPRVFIRALNEWTRIRPLKSCNSLWLYLYIFIYL